MAPTLTTPRNSDELAEMLADPTRAKQIMETPKALADFIDEYAQKQQGEGTDMQRQIDEGVQRGLANMLRDHDVTASGDAIKRLNLDPQTRPGNMLTTHRQATAYNPKAVGAALDGKFENAADFFRHAWHRNTDPAARAKMDELRNAYSSVIPADGGFLVPETLRSQLLQIALESSVVRSRATVVPMETARVPFPMIDSTTNVGSVFGGMIGYWGEEGAALVESNPKFGRAVLDAKKLTGFALVPNELLQDSLISFSALIETLWPQALAFFEDLAFMSGTGAGEPEGFLGAANSAGVAVTKESGQAADTIVVENVIKMYSRMLPSSLARGIWVCSPEAIPELYTMALSVGTGGGPVMLTNVAGPAPMTIFGRPLVVSEKAGRLGDRSDLAFVDLSYYLIGDRQQMTADSSTEYKFGNDQTAYRIIQRVDGRPWLQSAITPANGGPTLSPFVEIAERA
ncbi:phage major capsid protein [Streptomyces sp. ISL-98]|uniref:phage major capsid protein n=1 Tax=Streptomyces sp. ISL-98 TaxID=2819192 RepID=UPI001BECED91|nr:phage major capsid protein [Streptomyces sp. ISL-98]MBT2508814.1 phage major capsid protein [Streptomyces sp. ISL-98]